MSPPSDPLISARQAVDAAAAALRRAGVEDAGLDARVLAAAALGVEPGWLVLHPDHPVDAEAMRRFRRITARRAAREPVSHILGRREFWGLSFRVNAQTLAPRPDSETVVEAVLAKIRPRADAPLRVLDLGVGSGCLLLALLHECPAAFGVGVDISMGALSVAAENARALSLAGRAAFVCGDWLEALSGRFDVVVANPPYVAEAERGLLAPEVRFYEPERALFAGADGMAAFRVLCPGVARLLAEGGVCAFETAPSQAPDVAALLDQAGLRPDPPRSDLAGRARCVLAVGG